MTATCYELAWVDKTKTQIIKGDRWCVIHRAYYQTKAKLRTALRRRIKSGFRVQAGAVRSFAGFQANFVFTSRELEALAGMEVGPGTVPPDVYMGAFALKGEKWSRKVEEEREHSKRLREAHLKDYGPERPVARHSYYQHPSGYRMFWTTERDDDDWYWSWQERPLPRRRGQGRWKRLLMRKHRKRKDAKARAAKLYDKRPKEVGA